MRLVTVILLFVLSLAASAQEPVLVVVEKKASQVGFYTAAGERVAGVAVGETPHEMVLDPDGRHLYVSDNGVLWMTYEGPGGNTVSIVDIKERKKVGVISTGKFHRPHGMSIDPRTNRMIVTSENPDRLVLVDLPAIAVAGVDDRELSPRPGKRAGVAGLAAAQRIEHGPVEHDGRR
jgi:DNA-binding beta-propeller fold protein YncE